MAASDESGQYFEALHGAIASLAEETRLRMTELFDELAQTREHVHQVTQRLDALEGANERVAKDLARLSSVLDEDSAGTLNQIRTDLEVIRGELVELRARVTDAELSTIDAYIISQDRAAKPAPARKGA